MRETYLCALLVSVCILSCYGLDVCNTGFGNNGYSAPSGMCAWIFAGSVSGARGMVVAPNNDVLVISSSSIIVMWDANGDGLISNTERAVLAAQSGLNHGIVLHEGYVYATSATTLYRWSYTVGQRSNLGAATIVVDGMPSGGHTTRTPVFDDFSVLYISVGSGANVDSDSSRARVVRCPIDLDAIPSKGFQYATACKVFADGARNEAGLTFDRLGRLWGVENGVDNAYRADLGGDVHINNPCEEVNIFTKPAFYGYPYCWSEYNLSSPMAGGPKTQWAHANFINDGTHTDTWCKNTSNVLPPAWCMRPHTAPLDIKFLDFPSFPPPFNTGVFVSQRGSWNRVPPAGYQVVHLTLDDSLNPIQEKKFIGGYNVNNSVSEVWGTNRPVALARLSPCGAAKECLLISSDASNSIIAVAVSNKPTKTQ